MQHANLFHGYIQFVVTGIRQQQIITMHAVNKDILNADITSNTVN